MVTLLLLYDCGKKNTERSNVEKNAIKGNVSARDWEDSDAFDHHHLFRLLFGM